METTNSKKLLSLQKIAVFHITKGGRFFNSGGHRVFLGFGDIGHFLDYDNLWLPEGMETVPLEDKETCWRRESGSSTGLAVNNDGTGVCDIDGEFDTIKAKRLIDLEEEEVRTIYNQGSEDDREVLRESFGAEFMQHVFGEYED